MIMVKILYKEQELWDTVLIMFRKNENIFSCEGKTPFYIYTPQKLLRTKYHQATGYADPFLFANKKDGYLYLFNEMELLKAPAPLIAQRTKDLKHWEKLGVVLHENFHLSFPFVFEHEGEYYMIPETRSQEAVILYKADNFPYGWKPVKKLLQGDMYADSSVIFHNGLWYLFTTAWFGKKNGLRIFYSDSLCGDYVEHTMSPVTEDLALSRCAGSVFKYQGKLYRPAQYCSNYYGEDAVIYEIKELSPAAYSECLFKRMIDKSNPWSVRGGHQFNYAEFNGMQIVAMDGIVYDNWINNHTRKFFNFIHNHLKR